VRVVYDELHQTQPTGLRYAMFRLDDGRILAHVAVDETLHQRNPLEVAALPTRAISSPLMADECRMLSRLTAERQCGGSSVAP
jgi:hypothetical protein